MSNNLMIKMPYSQFMNYLKFYMNEYDKEQIVMQVYKGEINSLSSDDINEIVVEFLNTASYEFIMTNELYLIVFQSKPFIENNVFIGEINSALSEEKKQELLDYIKRSIQ